MTVTCIPHPVSLDYLFAPPDKDEDRKLGIARGRYTQMRIAEQRMKDTPRKDRGVTWHRQERTQRRRRNAFNAGGFKALMPKSTAPHTSTRTKRTKRNIERVKVVLAEKQYLGKERIHEECLKHDEDFDCSVSTVGLIKKELVESGSVKPYRESVGLKSRGGRKPLVGERKRVPKGGLKDLGMLWA